MDTKFQTSFIPKKPLVPSFATGKKRHTSFFSIIVVLIFVLSLAGAGAAYAYEKYLTASIANMNTTLAAAQAALDPALIAEWVRLDSRIESGKTLLGTHVALSSFFDLLETMTLKSVRFKNFTYGMSGQKIQIAMDGEADSFAAVALQSDEFAKHSKFITNQLFSNIDLDTDGQAVFRFTATLDPSVISYAVSIGDASAADTSTVPVGTEDSEPDRVLPRASDSVGGAAAGTTTATTTTP